MFECVRVDLFIILIVIECYYDDNDDIKFVNNIVIYMLLIRLLLKINNKNYCFVLFLLNYLNVWRIYLGSNGCKDLYNRWLC